MKKRINYKKLTEKIDKIPLHKAIEILLNAYECVKDKPNFEINPDFPFYRNKHNLIQMDYAGLFFYAFSDEQKVNIVWYVKAKSSWQLAFSERARFYIYMLYGNSLFIKPDTLGIFKNDTEKYIKFCYLYFDFIKNVNRLDVLRKYEYNRLHIDTHKYNELYMKDLDDFRNCLKKFNI